MCDTNAPNQRTEKVTRIPKARLDATVRQFKADPDYISHKTKQEDMNGDFWTIEVVLKDE